MAKKPLIDFTLAEVIAVCKPTHCNNCYFYDPKFGRCIFRMAPSCWLNSVTLITNSGIAVPIGEVANDIIGS